MSRAKQTRGKRKTKRKSAKKQERFARTRGLLRKNGVPILWVTLVLGGLAACGYGLYDYIHKSEYFLVRTIRVQGADLLDPVDIAQRAGVTTADNILFLDTGTVKYRVELMPYVKSCKVRRIFPDTVILSVVERQPVATLLVHNSPFAIDAEYTVLERLGGIDTHPGPYISEIVILDKPVEPGDRLEIDTIEAALSVWDAFCETNMSEDVVVSEIGVRGLNDIRMYCDDLDYEIRWRRSDVEGQALCLDALWHEKRRQLDCKEYLDLRFGRNLACK
jgi:hypothetical protein